jgi:hypothetical protein
VHRAKPRLRFTTMATALTGVVALGLSMPASAGAGQDAGTAGLDGRHTRSLEVVYQGLNGARKVSWDPVWQRVLVAEAGSVGAGPCTDPAGCFSQTGAIFAYTPWLNNDKRRIVTGLPAMVNAGGLSGVTEINALTNGQVLALFGLTGTVATRAVHGPAALPLGQLNRVGWNGQLTPVADLVAHEDANNPDAGGVNSNPFGVVTDSAGSTVVDAGANAVLRVAGDGAVSVLSVPPRIPFADRTIDPVPSGVTRGHDGAYYYGELTGGPFPVGAARVWRVAPGEAATTVATGLTNIIDLAVDRHGRLLVLEYATNGLASGDPTGRLVRVETNGSLTVLARDGLVNPGGVTVAPNGDVYITNRIVGPDGVGQLLRLRGAG